MWRRETHVLPSPSRVHVWLSAHSRDGLDFVYSSGQNKGGPFLLRFRDGGHSRPQANLDTQLCKV